MGSNKSYHSMKQSIILHENFDKPFAIAICIKIKCISASYTCMNRCAVHKVDGFHVGGRKDLGVDGWVGSIQSVPCKDGKIRPKYWTIPYRALFKVSLNSFF